MLSRQWHIRSSEPARTIARQIGFFYDNVGIFVAYRVVTEDMVIGLLGPGMNQLWDILEPYISREKEMRRTGYMVYCRTPGRVRLHGIHLGRGIGAFGDQRRKRLWRGWQDVVMGTIDDYLAGLDPADAAVIAHVYAVARAAVPDAEQATCYGMPTLMYRGKGLLAVMRTRKHIGLYPNSGNVLSACADQLADFDFDKGTLRFQPDSPPTDGLIKRIVVARRAEIDRR